MTGDILMERLKRVVDESGWLAETELDFADIYLEESPAIVPFELLCEEEGLIQIRRKFFYPLAVLCEALEEEAADWWELPKKPVFRIVIDPAYEWNTVACLIWSKEVIILISEKASDFWFDGEEEMADSLLAQFQNGLSRIQTVLVT